MGESMINIIVKEPYVHGAGLGIHSRIHSFTYSFIHSIATY